MPHSGCSVLHGVNPNLKKNSSTTPHKSETTFQGPGFCFKLSKACQQVVKQIQLIKLKKN